MQTEWKKPTCERLKRIADLASQFRDAAAEAHKAKVEEIGNIVNVVVNAQETHDAMKERILECLGKNKT